MKPWSGDKQNVGICTNKRQKNMFLWVTMCVNESHFLVRERRIGEGSGHGGGCGSPGCTIGGFEDAVERAPRPTGACGRIPWQCRARGRWDDTNQTVNSPFRERRQTGAHVAFPNFDTPKGKVYHALFTVALCNMNNINTALITNTVWPTSSV